MSVGCGSKIDSYIPYVGKVPNQVADTEAAIPLCTMFAKVLNARVYP
jgi:hypothetical protein